MADGGAQVHRSWLEYSCWLIVLPAPCDASKVARAMCLHWCLLCTGVGTDCSCCYLQATSWRLRAPPWHGDARPQQTASHMGLVHVSDCTAWPPPPSPAPPPPPSPFPPPPQPVLLRPCHGDCVPGGTPPQCTAGYRLHGPNCTGEWLRHAGGWAGLLGAAKMTVRVAVGVHQSRGCVWSRLEERGGAGRQ